MAYVGRRGRRKPHRRPSHRWDDSAVMDGKRTLLGCGRGLADSECGPLESFELCIEPPGFINSVIFFFFFATFLSPQEEIVNRAVCLVGEIRYRTEDWFVIS